MALRRAFVISCAAAGLVLPLAAAATPAAAQMSISTTEQQITFDPGDEYDPAISGDIVVYTAMRGGTETDVYYVNLSDGTVERAVSAAPGSQELSDVANGLVVYTDYLARDVYLYSTTTGETVNLTAAPGATSTNPAISSQLVAWEDTRDGNNEIYAMDLATGEERRITNSPASDSLPAASGSRITWQVCNAGSCDIALYDWNSGLTQMLTSTADADERRPDLDGNVIVYDRYSGAERDVYAYNLATGQQTGLALPSNQSNPNISGDNVVFEDISTGVYHLRLWNLRTGQTFQLTNGAGGEYLNDIDGNRVIYTAQRGGQLDLYLTTFTLNPNEDTTPPTVTPPGDVAATATSASGAIVTYPAATARDDVDGDLAASCTPASGSTFPLGQTTVTCTATDQAGNTGTAAFKVTVTYAWSGMQQPVNSDGTSVFKAGSTVPVKFTLTGASAPVTDATAKLSYAKISDGVEGTVNEATSTAAATTGNLFRYDPAASQYIFNWSTKGLTAGTYSVKIDLGDGVPRAVQVGLK